MAPGPFLERAFRWPFKTLLLDIKILNQAMRQIKKRGSMLAPVLSLSALKLEVNTVAGALPYWQLG
jgi:hypothetical protein